MALRKVIHAELRVQDLAAEVAFSTRVLGLGELSRGADGVHLGLDPGTARLTLLPGGTGVRSFCLGTDDEADVQALGAHLDAVGVPHAEIADPFPGVSTALELTLAGGRVIRVAAQPREPLYFTPAAGDRPPRRGIGPADLDHVTLGVPDDAAMRAEVEALRAALDVKVSDVVEDPEGAWLACWTRVDAQHHDVGLLRCGTDDTLHHLAWRLDGADHLKAAADELARAQIELETGIGRHGVGGNLYAYFWTPGGNRYELSAEMPLVAGARETPIVRRADRFSAFSAWGIPRPASFSMGS